jgi:hypothetical protein
MQNMCLHIIHYSKLTKDVCVCTVEMPLPECCVSAGTLLLNYSATNVAPTERPTPLLIEEEAAFPNT